MILFLVGVYVGVSLICGFLFGYLAWQTETWWRAVLAFLLAATCWPLLSLRLYFS